MDRDSFSAAYKGTKDFTQHNVHSTNATGFGAAADSSERGIDLNEQLIRNKPAPRIMPVLIRFNTVAGNDQQF